MHLQIWWEGFTKKKATWEPISECCYAPSIPAKDIIEKYLEDHPDADSLEIRDLLAIDLKNIIEIKGHRVLTEAGTPEPPHERLSFCVIWKGRGPTEKVWVPIGALIDSVYRDEYLKIYSYVQRCCGNDMALLKALRYVRGKKTRKEIIRAGGKDKLGAFNYDIAKEFQRFLPDKVDFTNFWHPGRQDQAYNDCAIHGLNLFLGCPYF